MSSGIFSGPSALGIDLTPPRPSGGGVPTPDSPNNPPLFTSTPAQMDACLVGWPKSYPNVTKQEDKDGLNLLCAIGPPNTLTCLDRCKTSGMPPAQKWQDCVKPCLASYSGPTTQTRICPKGQALFEGKCVNNVEQPPSPPAVKADTITTTTPPAVTGSKTPNPHANVPPLLVDGNQTAPISVPTWAWIVGAVGLAGLGWYFLKGGKKKVKRNAGHRSSGQFRRGQRVASKRSVDKKHSLRIEGKIKWVRGDLVMITTDNGEEWSLHTRDLKHIGSLRRNGGKRKPRVLFWVEQDWRGIWVVMRSDGVWVYKTEHKATADGVARRANKQARKLTLAHNGKIIASSFQRYNGGIRIKRLHGSSTVTRFYVFREEDRNDASKWLIVEGFGPTPGDRKTDAIRRSGLR